MDEKKIIEILKDHEERIKKLEVVEDHTQSLPGKPKEISLVEFVKEKNPTDDLQITLCIGSFLEQKEGVEFFTSKEIEEGFRKAKLKIPQNVTDKVNQCIKKGWVAENKEKRDGKKTFYSTISGQEKIDGDFKKNV